MAPAEIANHTEDSNRTSSKHRIWLSHQIDSTFGAYENTGVKIETRYKK